ncbi:metallophosphoesterase [Rhodoblastus sp.]|jgi:Icc-related predicted phosphoesterase|uniref:metallophosphoesterase n=1 Tax=Rhodoblastus sp. TaxID=1962975 RepID=UPI0025D330F9|nr:metallophosphoesterase [Rhodoblastus sp.]
MRVAIMSDLHLEFERGPVRGDEWSAFVERRASILWHPRIGPLLDEAVGVDLLILAGDIDVGTRGMAYADEVAQYIGAPVVYVLGNHEGYDGTPFDRLFDALREKATVTQGRVSFLENSRAEFGDVHVLGATLWTDYAANGRENVETAMREANNCLNDHVRCRLGGNKFRPPGARSLHFASRAWLRDEVAKIRANDPEAKIVIVTHHAPIIDGAAPEYRGDILSPAFVSDLSAEIQAWRPTLWVFGHTHFNVDKFIGSTRVVSAQRGYVGEAPAVESFRPAIVEI